MTDVPQLCVGDKSDHGGQIISGDPLATLNGKSASRIADLHACILFYETDPFQTAPIPFTSTTRVTPFPHGITPIIIGANIPNRMLINGRLAAYEGDRAGCGCVLKSSNPNLTSAIALGFIAVSVLALGGRSER